jgi:GWxTD domain-containing protein
MRSAWQRSETRATRWVALVVFAGLMLTGCAAREARDWRGSSVGGTPGQAMAAYAALGFITGPSNFPAVASLWTLAGPGDSTWVTLGVSVPNTALRFVRDGDDFVAESSVEIVIMDRDSLVATRGSARRHARLQSFEETNRPGARVVFQHAIAVKPGQYDVRVQVADVNSGRSLGARDTLTVPAYGDGLRRLPPPVLVEGATGRSTRAERPALLPDPRRTARFGGAVPSAYVEAYGASAAPRLAIIDMAGDTVWTGIAEMAGDTSGLRWGAVELPGDVLLPGVYRVQAAVPGEAPATTTMLLTVDDRWVITGFDDLIRTLRPIAHDEELEALLGGTPRQRHEAWEAFWERRDPGAGAGFTPFRDEYFHRVWYAAEAFRQGSRPGSLTQRGEVYIVLGPPDYIMERQVGQALIPGRPNAEEWVYGGALGGPMSLLFVDRVGTGHLELIPESAATFRMLAERMKPRRPGRD